MHRDGSRGTHGWGKGTARKVRFDARCKALNRAVTQGSSRQSHKGNTNPGWGGSCCHPRQAPLSRSCSLLTRSSTLLSSSCRWSVLKIGLFLNYLAAFAAPGFYGWKAESH